MQTAESLLLMANAMAEMANTVHYDYGPQFASPQFFQENTRLKRTERNNETRNVEKRLKTIKSKVCHRF